MNQNPINNEILEDRPNIQIPIDDSEQILIDEPEDSNHSAINKNGIGINNYIEDEEMMMRRNPKMKKINM